MALGHVTTGSTITTMGVGVVGPTMEVEGMVDLLIGIITAMLEALEHRIGGTSAVMLPPKVVTSCFFVWLMLQLLTTFILFDEIS